MKKIWCGIAATLLGSSLVFAYDTEIPYVPVIEQAEQTAITSESPTGLTPRRAQTTVIRAQQSAPPTPFIPYYEEAPPVAEAAPRVATVAFAEVAAPATAGSDTYVYAELERLNSVIQQLGAGITKPNPRTSWSTPKLGGRLHLDNFSINQHKDDDPDYQNKAGLSELRLTITGNGYEAFDYKAELVCVGTAQISILDTWIGAKNVPGLGYFRVGHYNVETGLMYMGGSAQTTLTAFSPATLSFNLGRKFGCSSDLLFANKRIRWHNGIFQGQSINGPNGTLSVQNDDQGLIYNTRLTAVPYYANDGRYMLHVGGHYSYIDEVSSYKGVNSFLGGTNFLGTMLTTGQNDVSHHHRGGLEMAYQAGPFRALVESFAADYGSEGTATGTVVEMTYFLTGEHRSYNLDFGVFGAPAKVNRPFRPFKCGDWNLVDGMGAWQLVTRYNYTDLSDWGYSERITTNPDQTTTTTVLSNGGYQHDWTVGLNWYWTTNLRCIFEYTHSRQDTGQAYARSYQDVFGTSIRVVW